VQEPFGATTPVALLPPHLPPVAPKHSGTSATLAGVSASDGSDRAASKRRRTGLHLWMVVLASLTLLGQGERCLVDPRFASPSATLLTFWSAMREGNAEEVWECFVEGRDDLPMPGMLWFLPPTERISLAEFRALPVTAGRVLVRYEVHFVPRGFDEERVFVTGDELVRLRGQWRIARPIGQVSAPIWDKIPPTVDS
jgi:hypothetical protein